MINLNKRNNETKQLWKIILTAIIISLIVILIIILKNTQLLQRITLGNKAETEETIIEYEMLPNEQNNLNIFLQIENKLRNRKNNSIRWNYTKC